MCNDYECADRLSKHKRRNLSTGKLEDWLHPRNREVGITGVFFNKSSNSHRRTSSLQLLLPLLLICNYFRKLDDWLHPQNKSYCGRGKGRYSWNKTWIWTCCSIWMCWSYDDDPADDQKMMISWLEFVQKYCLSCTGAVISVGFARPAQMQCTRDKQWCEIYFYIKLWCLNCDQECEIFLYIKLWYLNCAQKCEIYLYIKLWYFSCEQKC